MANMRRAKAREMVRAVAVLTVDPDGQLPLPEPAVDRLNAAGGWWVVTAQKQIMLTPVARARAPKAEIRDGRLLLPDAIMQKLEAMPGALIALIGRWDDKLVLKRVDPAVVKEATTRRGGIPQVLAITRCSKDGRFVLKGNVREKLGPPPYFLTTAGEVRISANADEGGAPFPLVKNRGTLPAAVLTQLGITGACRVALVQREDGVAVKRLDLEQRQGGVATVYDVETAHVVTRVAEANPKPEDMLARLEKAARAFRLRTPIGGFIQGRESLDAWVTRHWLDRPDPDDATLRDTLVEERLAGQQEGGSWNGEIVLTARNLRELGELGSDRDHPALAAGAEWLLARRETELEPGFFFNNDELVDELERIWHARRQGSKERFRKGHGQFVRAEVDAVVKGHDLIRLPCGPRVTWPNALAVGALLQLGYDEHPRVQRAVSNWMNGGYCECGHQGHPDRRRGLWDLDAIAEKAGHACAEFELAGIPGLEELANMDASKTSGLRMPRAGHRCEDGRDIYPLAMPRDFAPCGLWPLIAMAKASDARIRNFGEAELWRLLAVQGAPDEPFPGLGQFHEARAEFLAIFAGYDCLPARLGILKWLPWIAESQNSDGSWGNDPHRDAATRAVLCALLRVRNLFTASLV